MTSAQNTVTDAQATSLLHRAGLTTPDGIVLGRRERRQRGYRQPLPPGWYAGMAIPGSLADARQRAAIDAGRDALTTEGIEDAHA